MAWCIRLWTAAITGNPEAANWLLYNPYRHRINLTAVLCVQVLEKFEILYPVSALEINVEPFCHDQMYRSLLVPVACVSTPL